MTMIEKVAMAIANTIDDGTFYNATVFQSAARAAIEAMKEPTAEMQRAAEQAAFGYPRAFHRHWNAMLDAALSETPKP